MQRRALVAGVAALAATRAAQDVTIARVLSSRWIDDRHRPSTATITAG